MLGSAVGLAAPIMDAGLAQSLADLLNAIGSDNPAAALAAIFLGCIIVTNVIIHNFSYFYDGFSNTYKFIQTQ
jgi:di/tricarboxylate transporter